MMKTYDRPGSLVKPYKEYEFKKPKIDDIKFYN